MTAAVVAKLAELAAEVDAAAVKAAAVQAVGVVGSRGSDGSLGTVGQAGRVGSGGFYTGQRVRVRGLLRDTFLNGVQGVLLEPGASKSGGSFWRVRLDTEFVELPRHFAAENIEAFDDAAK